MILSEEYKFIFVHVPKTGGSSLSFALRPYERTSKRTKLRSLSRRLPIKEDPLKAHFRVHDTASKIIQKIGRKKFETYTSFSVVRNPFNSAVSHYEYMKQFRTQKVANRFSSMTFAEYLNFRVSANGWLTPRFARMPNQTDFVVDQDGKLAVSRFLKLENLERDFEKLCTDLALPKTELTRRNKTKAKKKSAQEYFNTETIALIHQLYGPDFEMFGYSKQPPLG